MDLIEAKNEAILKIKFQAKHRIEDSIPLWKQINAALGLYDAEKTQAIKDAISAVRTASDTAEAAVNALEDVAAVEGFAW